MFISLLLIIIYLNAADVTVTIEAPFNSIAVFDYYGVESFNSLLAEASKTYISNFGLGNNTVGTYQDVTIEDRDIYGGAGRRVPTHQPHQSDSETIKG